VKLSRPKTPRTPRTLKMIDGLESGQCFSVSLLTWLILIPDKELTIVEMQLAIAKK
jgi:hypothetical protein